MSVKRTSLSFSIFLPRSSGLKILERLLESNFDLNYGTKSMDHGPWTMGGRESPCLSQTLGSCISSNPSGGAISELSFSSTIICIGKVGSLFWWQWTTLRLSVFEFVSSADSLKYVFCWKEVWDSYYESYLGGRLKLITEFSMVTWSKLNIPFVSLFDNSSKNFSKSLLLGSDSPPISVSWSWMGCPSQDKGSLLFHLQAFGRTKVSTPLKSS